MTVFDDIKRHFGRSRAETIGDRRNDFSKQGIIVSCYSVDRLEEKLNITREGNRPASLWIMFDPTSWPTMAAPYGRQL